MTASDRARSPQAPAEKAQAEQAPAEPAPVEQAPERDAPGPDASDGAPRADAAARAPDFYIVGHAKCGTTALYEMLRRHPQIFMPALKEPQFFAAQAPPAGHMGPWLGHSGRNMMSLEQYLSLFEPARDGQITGEASTFYLWSRIAPERIAAARPDARIIAILREPAAFLASLHLQMLQNNAESETDLRAALALEAERREGRAIPRSAGWPEALLYSERVRYAEQLRRYHAAFGRDQVLVLIYDDLRRDNDAQVRRVLRFLGVDDSVTLPSIEANPTVALRSRRVNDLRHALSSGRGPLARAARATGKALTTRSLRRALYYPNVRRASFRAPPPPDAALMAELRERFRGEVVELSEYLGRDLIAEWGYGRAA